MTLEHLLRTETRRLAELFGDPVPDDRDAILRRLDELTNLHAAAEAARRLIAAHGQTYVAQAMRLGIDPADLVGRPYSRTTVNTLRVSLGLPRRPPGPQPVRPAIG